MKSPDRLGIDVDNGVAHLLTVASVIDALPFGITCEVFITTRKDELSHFHVETNFPTSIIIRRFLGDDEERIKWASCRRKWNGRPPDFLGNANKKRFKLSNTLFK